MRELLQSKPDGFASSPERGSWRAYARLRGFSLEEIGRIVYYIILII